MGSLNTNAGTPRKENRYISNLSYGGFTRYAYKNGALQGSPYLGLFWYGYEYDKYFGVDIPNFHARKSAGELLPYTPYTKGTQEISNIRGYLEYEGQFSPTNTGWYFVIRSNEGSHPFMESPDGTNLFTGDPINEANSAISERFGEQTPYSLVQAAAAKAYSSGWDTLTFLAEFHHVLRMFKSILSNLSSLAKSPDNLRDAWLEGRYGWRVLVYDILDANEAIRKLSKKQSQRTKERTGTTLSWTNSYESLHENPFCYYNSRVITDKCSLGLRGRVISDFTPPAFQFNPVTTAWELVTLSFVIDWVWNVGQALNAMSFLVLSGEYSACWSLQYDKVRTYSSTFTPKSGWTINGLGSFTETTSIIHRHPCVVPKLPSINVRLDEFKVLDLIALLWQRLF
jgi:hypothetical protein